jgi:ABC-type nitrate/sulfonate/bicarbonate transport system substrate-binding protein
MGVACATMMLASQSLAQEKFRFPVGESSKTLRYWQLWIAGKMGFFKREGLDVPIVTMRGSPLTIQALTADSISSRSEMEESI